ncbi:MAG: tetratricopeptide repeat protein, partial [Treponema sp.]|nr:tetratricopeptide repeat protein [Treponema sp.]
MPSLKALGEFKSSFSRIGNEDQIRNARDLPPDDLPLPDHEPAALPAASSDAPPDEGEGFPAVDSGAPGSDFIDFGDLGDLVGNLGPSLDLDGPALDSSAEETPASPEGDADFNDFLDNIPDDFAVSDSSGPVPSVSEEPAAEDFSLPEEIDTNPAEAKAESADDFGFPDSLLDGLAGELESEEAAEDAPAELSAFEEIPSEEIPSLEAVSGETETAAEPEDPETEDDMDLSFPEGESGFDLGGESLDSGTAAAAEGGDSFDNFNLDNDALAADFNLGEGLDAGDTAAGGFGNDFANLEEFSLPGIDDTFSGRTPGAVSGQQTGAGQPVPLDEGEILGEVEEIQLSEDELSRLMETLAAYPLNLRIACEELIAEEAVAPDLMSNLIKLLVRGAPPKETAVLAGKILGRAIRIPKGFEKKTGEELEAEQGSFAYIFIHNFLPVLRLFLGIAMVAVSLGYLVWNFIITPARAEKIYKLGYERIFAGEYSRADDRFQEAFRIHQKKDWFYKYAEAFRDERQYIHAARMYGSLLNYTAAKSKKHIPEKKAVLDYAALETYYL